MADHVDTGDPGGHAALHAVLPGRPPPGLDALEAHEARTLADTIAEVTAAHREELIAAARASLGLVPRVVRPAIRRIIGL
jgi:hypothetical protein